MSNLFQSLSLTFKMDLQSGNLVLQTANATLRCDRSFLEQCNLLFVAGLIEER